MDMLWFLMLSHLVGDYALQTDAMARNKRSSRRALTWHVFIYVTTLAVTLALYSWATGAFPFFAPRTLLALAVIFALHWIQDDVKGRWFADSRQAYYFDQALHIAQLFMLRDWLA